MSDNSDGTSGPLLIGTERIIYEGPELRLTQLDLDLPDGDRIWWDSVRVLRTASVALIDADDRVLLLRRRRLIQDRSGWELPGSVVDDGEDPRDTIIRELSELTGYRAARLTPVQSFQSAPHSVDGERLLFVGRDPERVQDAGPACDAQEWVALDAVLERVKNGQIWDSATLVTLLGLLARAW